MTLTVYRIGDQSAPTVAGAVYMYLDEVQAWTHSILAQESTGPSAWDGYMSLVVADACVRSAESGQPQDVPVVGRPELYAR